MVVGSKIKFSEEKSIKISHSLFMISCAKRELSIYTIKSPPLHQRITQSDSFVWFNFRPEKVHLECSEERIDES